MIHNQTGLQTSLHQAGHESPPKQANRTKTLQAIQPGYLHCVLIQKTILQAVFQVGSLTHTLPHIWNSL